MIGIVLVTYEGIGEKLLNAVNHILGYKPEQVGLVSVGYDDSPERLRDLIYDQITSNDGDEGTLILCDVFGATHTNATLKLGHFNNVSLVSGLNLPMFIKALNYRELSIGELVRKVVDGGKEGIVADPMDQDLKK